MEIIRAWNSQIIEYLGYQYENTNVSLRLNRYCISHTVDGGILLFNGITYELLLITAGEEASFMGTEYAIRHWFVVPHSFDEQKLIRQLQDKLKENDGGKARITKYTVFTTTACNANCYYCFENGQCSAAFMDEEVAQKLSQHIVADNSKDVVELAWFGGEPLLNTDVIDYICAELKRNKVNYFSTMASNALLFTPSIILKAKEIWNLKYLHVTLDGTSDYYNKTKNYAISKQTDAFKVVLENIKRITESGIFVAIKLNISHNNRNDLLNLVDQLADTFKFTDLIGVHCACLFGIATVNDLTQIKAESRELYNAQSKIMEKIHHSGLYKFNLPSCLRIYHCNPDAGREITVLPDGKIGWCEHYLKSNFIGDVSSFELDYDKIGFLKTRYADLEECGACPVYPQCIRLKICSAASEWCIEEKRKCMIKEIQMQMHYEYKLFKKSSYLETVQSTSNKL